MGEIKKIGLTLLVTLHCSFALANGLFTNAKVIQVRIDSNGHGMVVFDQQAGGTPPSSCVDGSIWKNSLAFDLNTVGGKGIMAMALAAKASGTPIVNAQGAGTCAIYSWGAEDWASGY